jgi:hypothetical protein
MPYVTLHSIRGLAALILQHCPLFHYKVIALKSRTFVLKSRATLATKSVLDLNAKVATMAEVGRGSLERSNQKGLILCLIQFRDPLSAV